MTIMAIHPWHRARAAQLFARAATLPHALLVHGPAGIGKRAFAAHVAARLLCDAPRAPGESGACGACRGCRLFAACTHPDLHVVEPEAGAAMNRDLLDVYAQKYVPEKKGDRKPSAVVRIDQIRDLVDTIRLRPQISAWRVTMLLPAESININAANSFLKILEEPPSDTLIMLVTAVPGRLPATIRSRCVSLPLSTPSRSDALAWMHDVAPDIAGAETSLALAGGAPLLALSHARTNEARLAAGLADDLCALATRRRDLGACAARWKEQGAEISLSWLETVVAEVIRARAAPDAARRLPPHAPLQRIAERLHSTELHAFYNRVSRGRVLSGGPLDEQLLIEDILVAWLDLTDTPTKSLITSSLNR